MFVSLHVGTRNRTQVLCNGSKHCWPLSHPSSPSGTILFNTHTQTSGCEVWCTHLQSQHWEVEAGRSLWGSLSGLQSEFHDRQDYIMRICFQKPTEKAVISVHQQRQCRLLPISTHNIFYSAPSFAILIIADHGSSQLYLFLGRLKQNCLKIAWDS